MHKASDYFFYPDSLPFSEYFSPNLQPWEWVPQINQALKEIDSNIADLNIPNSLHISGKVFIDPNVVLPAFGSIEGPAYISKGCKLRPGVFVRGNLIAGEGCVLGNSCEFKNSLLLDGVQVPHFSYVGDSILGNGVHLGAGAICSNLRIDKTNVPVVLEDGKKYLTKLRKLGALIGDNAEVGCNVVLNPGSILGKSSRVMPSISFSGTLNENETVKK